MPDTDEKVTAPKASKKGSATQAKNIKRAENAEASYENDKAKMPAAAEQDATAVKSLLADLTTLEKKRTSLLTEAERTTVEINEKHKALRKHTANLGRYADTVFGVGSVESKAYRNDD